MKLSKVIGFIKRKMKGWIEIDDISYWIWKPLQRELNKNYICFFCKKKLKDKRYVESVYKEITKSIPDIKDKFFCSLGCLKKHIKKEKEEDIVFNFDDKGVLEKTAEKFCKKGGKKK